MIKENVEASRLAFYTYIFIACFLVLTFHAVYSIYDFAVDDSIPLVVCPRSFDLDAPVIMNTINDHNSVYIQDRWIKGFVRRFVRSNYPRTAEDAEPLFTYARDRSFGPVRDKFQAYLNDISEIREKIGSGNIIRFHPTNSSEVRIRRNGDISNQWTVEIDGYLTKDLNGREERTVRTLRYIIESAPATRSNPDGLYVVEANMEYIVDYVSGKKEGQE